ncbi:MAG: FtsW/RodA/SpoVE family cell cycle protein [Clostridia bacterium]|nr:FtsW/RodA/SpoVE family cell cycle protein [Clostridia bacterium]
MRQEEAEERAISQMGNAEEIGKSLNKIHKPRFDWKILATVSVLLVFGLLVAYTRDNLFYSYLEDNSIGITYGREFGAKFIEYFAWTIISIVGLASIRFIDYTKISKYSFQIYLIALFVTIACIFRENMNCIDVGVAPLYIMQTFFMPLYIIAFAGFMKDLDKESKIKVDNMKDRNVNIIQAIVLGVISILLVLQIPSVLYAVVLGITYIIMAGFRFILEHKNKEKIFKIFNKVLICVVIAITIFTIYMLINGSLVIENGRNMGTNDTFSLIFVNYGLIVSVLTIICIGLFSTCLVVSVSKVKELYGKMLSIGVASMFLIQILFSVLSNLKYGFEWGTQMPFLSYGITNLLVNMMCLGLVLAVYRRKDILQKVEA